MSYRIDIDGRNRYNAAGDRATAMLEEQRRFFIEQINAAVRERAEAGGPNAIDALKERAIVVEKGIVFGRLPRKTM